MRRPVVAAALALALGCALATAAAAQNSYQQQIRNQLATASDTVRAHGYSADREAMMGSLNASAKEAMMVNLLGGARYAIVGVCDNDCSDVDLRIWAPDGTKLAEDILLDDTPVLEFTATVTGQYRLSVEMATCRTNPCYWGVQVLQEIDAQTDRRTDGQADGRTGGRSDTRTTPSQSDGPMVRSSAWQRGANVRRWWGVGPHRASAAKMVRRAVAGVALPPVGGVAQRQQAHQVVPHGLGHDARAGDGVAATVPSHQRVVGHPQLGHRESVQEDLVGGDREAQHRAAHRQRRGAADVEAVDLPRARGADGIGQAGNDRRREVLAAAAGQQLRIGDALETGRPRASPVRRRRPPAPPGGPGRPRPRRPAARRRGRTTPARPRGRAPQTSRCSLMRPFLPVRWRR